MIDLQGEQIRTEYVNLNHVVLWDENPKEHDIGSIVASIRRYGFRDPLGYDSVLGALVEGHGRSHALRMMREAGEDAPRGIATDNAGAWYVPVLFGVDAESEATAKAYAIDHNNLTMAGEFEVWDVARIWDEGAYTALLQEMAASNVFPVTVDNDDLDALLREFGLPDEFPEYDESVADEVEMITCPHCGKEFPK